MMRIIGTIAAASLVLSACGGGGGGGGSPTPAPTPTPTPTPTPPGGGKLYAAPALEALTAADVGRIVAQGVAEASARGLPANIVVVDRVGNVLAAFTMNGANQRLTVPLAPDGTEQDLQGVDVPAAVAGAISKAVTGAYLSSGGNAFSTRTGSMIVQEHFPPTAIARGLESGPLFGVQFSQLPCSDVNFRFNGNVGPAGLIGPKRTPFGLSADAGGFPLYKNGVVVGGVGVMADGVYGFDPEIQDIEDDPEEIIALAAATGFAAPAAIRADRIPVDGTTLRFSDATPGDFRSDPAAAPGFAAIDGRAGTLASVRGYFDASGGIVAGRAYGSEASGIRAAKPGEFANPDAFVLTSGSGGGRFPIRDGTDAGSVPQPLTRAEVAAMLEEAFAVMSQARAQIRRPLNSRAQVSIAIVDTHGAVLGLVRAPDAPIFGIDVSVQKARSSAFFSSARAGASLEADPDPDVAMYAQAARAFFGSGAFTRGAFAISARALGNASRPYFPDGEVGRLPGPFSRPVAKFNPFSTGLQSALVEDNIRDHAAFILGGGADTPRRCTRVPEAAPGQSPIANGIQIFPGSVPIYRGTRLVGAIGVSGDGIDQDDMIGFLGVHEGGARAGTVGNADPAIRSDRIEVAVGGATVRLRWVNCPFAPFLGSTEQNVCQGK